MTPKINEEIRQALHQQQGKPLEVEDEQTHLKYVMIPVETFQKVQALFYDDGEFDPSEAYPLLDQTFGGPEGWDAPGMEVYDDYDAHRPKA
jgi:hypothetical protein